MRAGPPTPRCAVAHARTHGLGHTPAAPMLDAALHRIAVARSHIVFSSITKCRLSSLFYRVSIRHHDHRSVCRAAREIVIDSRHVPCPAGVDLWLCQRPAYRIEPRQWAARLLLSSGATEQGHQLVVLAKVRCMEAYSGGTQQTEGLAQLRAAAREETRGCAAILSKRCEMRVQDWRARISCENHRSKLSATESTRDSSATEADAAWTRRVSSSGGIGGASASNVAQYHRCVIARDQRPLWRQLPIKGLLELAV